MMSSRANPLSPAPRSWRAGRAGIVPQSRVVVEILVAQRLGVNALPQQLLHRMVDPARVAAIGKASRQRAGHAQAVIDLAQEQHPTVTRQRSRAETAFHFARSQLLKQECLLLAVWRKPGAAPCLG
jgi:hypothetical protein